MNFQKIAFFLCFITLQITAQSIQIKVLDAKTNLPLPYANVNINDKTNIIANEEGIFSLTETQNIDSDLVVVSYLGYASIKKTLGAIKEENLIVKLIEGSYQLENVDIKYTKPNPEKIMLEVKKRLSTNYKNSTGSTSKSIFMRASDLIKSDKIEIEIDKSTGFTKQQLKTVEEEFRSYTNKITNKNLKSYKDILANYHQSKNSSNKPIHKLEVLKATLMKGDETTTSTDDIMKNFNKLIFKHLDSTKFYRMKSGWFGSKDTIRLKENSKGNKKESNILFAKNSFRDFLGDQKFSDSKFDFINNPEIYEYTLKGTTYNDNDELIYILNFSPKKSRAKFSGTLYITQNDFAVIKCNYKLEDGESLEGMNLKLLLGIKYRVNKNAGIVRYKKNLQTNNYELEYASEEKGTYVYVNRPIKFIELTKQEKDIFAFNVKFEANTLVKKELFTISSTEISPSVYNAVDEKDFKYIKLKKYDPNIWKNYIAIEPLETMKQYKELEE